MQTVKITAELSSDEALAFAQFLKRSHFGTFERLSDPTRKDEPQLMIDAAVKLQMAFRESGYAPR